ncbi:hypothetical protein HZB02_05705 [Candidatus Woesearchaeota archaeon]|nr:hypothetical protein [Candidatus Woesearchaeota archaeon]
MKSYSKNTQLLIMLAALVVGLIVGYGLQDLVTINSPLGNAALATETETYTFDLPATAAPADVDAAVQLLLPMYVPEFRQDPVSVATVSKFINAQFAQTTLPKTLGKGVPFFNWNGQSSSGTVSFKVKKTKGGAVGTVTINIRWGKNIAPFSPDDTGSSYQIQPPSSPHPPGWIPP